jgi:hypothetical protein
MCRLTLAARQLVLGLPPDGIASRATKMVIGLAREEIKDSHAPVRGRPSCHRLP